MVGEERQNQTMPTNEQPLLPHTTPPQSSHILSPLSLSEGSSNLSSVTLFRPRMCSRPGGSVRSSSACRRASLLKMEPRPSATTGGDSSSPERWQVVQRASLSSSGLTWIGH